MKIKVVRLVIILITSLGFFCVMFFWDRSFSIESIESEDPLKIVLFLIISLLFGFGAYSGFKLKK